MKPAITTITHQGRTFTEGQTVHIPKLDYTGKIVRFSPWSATQPARAHVAKEGDRYGRTVKLGELKAVKP
jgi:hypothetical protein